MTCPACAQRTRANLGPCPGCGSIAVPFLDGYLNAPPGPEPRHTVPWDPELETDSEISGRVLRAVLMAARIANERRWSAEALRRLPRYHYATLEAACCRVAIRWGLIR